jgi:surface protein
MWTTTSSSETITLPLNSSGTYNFIVNWGDGNFDTITSWNQPQVTHTYSVAGTYQVDIIGEISGWSFNNLGDRLKIVEVKSWGPLKLGNSGGYFYGCSNIILSSVTDGLDIIGGSTTDLSNMFRDCSSITTINNINLWNTSSVNTMNSMFRGERGGTLFNDYINWDTSSVTDMSHMFDSATSFNNGGVTTLNLSVSNVIDMSYMFSDATSFNCNIGSWQPTLVTNMSHMFDGATDFSNAGGDFSIWQSNTSNVIDMSYMFRNAKSFNNSNINQNNDK